MNRTIALVTVIGALAASVGTYKASASSVHSGSRTQLSEDEAGEIAGGVLADIALPIENAQSKEDNIQFDVSLNSSHSNSAIQLYSGSTKVAFEGLDGGAQEWSERVPWPPHGPSSMSMKYAKDGSWYGVAGIDPTRAAVEIHPDVKVYGVYFHNLKPGHMTEAELETVVDNREFIRDWTQTPSVDATFADQCPGNEVVQFRFMGMDEQTITVQDSGGHQIDCSQLTDAYNNHRSGNDDGFEQCQLEIGKIALGNLLDPVPPDPTDPDHPDLDPEHPRLFLHVFNIQNIPNAQSQVGQFQPVTLTDPGENLQAGMIFMTKPGVQDYVGKYATVLGHEIMHHFGGHCGPNHDTCGCGDCGANCKSNNDVQTNILCEQGGREMKPAQCQQLAEIGLPYRDLNSLWTSPIAPETWGW